MNGTSITRKILLASVITLAGIAGCGKSVSGKYQDKTQMMSVEFKSGGKAYMTMLGSTIQADYTIDGDKVICDTHAAPGKVVITINSDGTLTCEGETLTKSGS